MIKLNESKSKAIAIRCWWTNYIYWFPTIQTELHLVPNSCLTSLSIRNVFRAKGNNITINFYFLGIVVNIDYWWKLS